MNVSVYFTKEKISENNHTDNYVYQCLT